MSANQLARLPDEERDLMAPRWVYDLAEIDPLDAILGTAGTLVAYGAGGVPGIVVWGGAFIVITVVRKTPLVPWVVRVIADWRTNPKIVTGHFRDAVIPAMREGAGEIVFHPGVPRERERGQAQPPQAEPLAYTYAPVASPVQPAPPMRSPTDAPNTTAHAPSGVRALVQQYQELNKLLPLHGRHIVIFGPTGIGKSSIIKWLLKSRQKGLLIICDPHYQPGNWPSRAYVVGKGRNFAEIAAAIAAVLAEMDRRYTRSGNGQLNLDEVEPLYLVVDEQSALAEQEPEAIKQLLTIAQEGRKTRIFTILTPHGQNVDTMGLKGRGEARKNFAFISGEPVTDEFKKFPRIVTVTLGAPKDADSQVLGRFVVPAPPVYTGTPHFGVPSFLGDGLPPALQQSVSGVCLPSVSNSQSGVSQGVFEQLRHGVSEVGHTPDTGFEQRFKADSDEARELAQYLAEHGYGIRKIRDFLPFASAEAQALARAVLSSITQLPLRPAAGSAAEQALVRYLHENCGAPLERIARLLDGNTWENLARIQGDVAINC